MLARPLGAPLNGLALLVALNLLIPLVLGGASSLEPLGARAAVSGTIFAAAADAVAVLLLHARAPGFERRRLRMETAGLLVDLSLYWLALTALIVTANSFGETAAKSLERIIGTVLGLLAGTLIWIAASRVPALAAAVVVICVFAIFYERTARYRTVLFWLSLLLSLLFHLADAPDLFYVARLADTLIGAAIAVLVTVVLLPVRTGDEAREQMAALLDLAAGKLQRMASVLALPGPHTRDGGLGQLLDASEKLAGLTAAEGLEALLLRRPRAEVRGRMAYAADVGRCLLYSGPARAVAAGSGTRDSRRPGRAGRGCRARRPIDQARGNRAAPRRAGQSGSVLGQRGRRVPGGPDHAGAASGQRATARDPCGIGGGHG